jgi:hypothetical protein
MYTIAGMNEIAIVNAGRTFCQIVRLIPSERWIECLTTVSIDAPTPPRAPSYGR